MRRDNAEPTFRLRFSRKEIASLAEQYNAENPDRNLEDEIETTIGPRMRRDHYLAKNDFLQLCKWKTKRTQKACASNGDDFLESVTKIALRTSCEELRISILTLLHGVDWPTSSVILHFGHDNQYPILDFRALWSLGVAPPSQYSFPFWLPYTEYCRRLGAECGVSLRVLDQALWQYSKENQPKNT
jgi:hypothetical protein